MRGDQQGDDYENENDFFVFYLLSFVSSASQHQKALHLQWVTMMMRSLGENARGSTREMRGGIERQPRHSFQNSFRPPLAAAL